jgi:biopolymer transport protein ExbB
MNPRSIVVGLAVTLLASPLSASEVLERAASSAEHDFRTSLKELTELRDRIAAERLPLARELDGLENRLRDLRRAQDQELRGIDTASLDLAALQGEQKLRQEEIGYVGSLLDEYARSLESRLHVAELPRYSGALAAAREATSDATLTPPERLTRQLAMVSASLTRADDLIGGARFEGRAVDARGVVTPGRFAMVGPVALFAADEGGAAGLALAQSGSTQPVVRPLEESLTPGIAAVVNDGAGSLPVDPTLGAALKELVQRYGLVHLFKKGGPIMWPLLAVSILALGTVVERVVFVLTERRRRDERGLRNFLAAVERSDLMEAARIGATSKSYVVRALTYALQHREKSLSSALLYAQAQEIKRFSRGLPVLDTAITISPLLGLLGTVTGMMHSFSLIGGELSAPAAITGGIAEALIATAFGLGIAILALIPFNFLNNRIEEARHELDAAATQLELLVHPNPAPARPAARSGLADVPGDATPDRAHGAVRGDLPAPFVGGLRAAQE